MVGFQSSNWFYTMWIFFIFFIFNLGTCIFWFSNIETKFCWNSSHKIQKKKKRDKEKSKEPLKGTKLQSLFFVMLCLMHAHLIMTGESFFACRCLRLDGANHNNNRNNTTRNWIVLLNILNLKRKVTQHYLDWGWHFIFHNKNGVLIRPFTHQRIW